MSASLVFIYLSACLLVMIHILYGQFIIRASQETPASLPYLTRSFLFASVQLSCRRNQRNVDFRENMAETPSFRPKWRQAISIGKYRPKLLSLCKFQTTLYESIFPIRTGHGWKFWFDEMRRKMGELCSSPCVLSHFDCLLTGRPWIPAADHKPVYRADASFALVFHHRLVIRSKWNRLID